MKKEIGGQRFSRLLVIEFVCIDQRGKARWKCLCDCGKTVTTMAVSLLAGNTKSCGCLKVEKARRPGTMNHAFKHGHGGSSKQTPEYMSWASMIKRCNNPQDKAYDRYGGRGIKVCDRWKDFSLFLEDMGLRPEGFSIERINVDGDYEPSNCEWIPNQLQQRNKRNSRWMAYRGEKRCVSEWAELLGLPAGTIFSRINAGWSDEEALTKPVGKSWKSKRPADNQPMPDYVKQLKERLVR